MCDFTHKSPNEPITPEELGQVGVNHGEVVLFTLLWEVLDSHQTRSYDQAVQILGELLAMNGDEEMAQRFELQPV